ncbi:hypothetical protein BU15DRAFT_63436 [Melanogaster broomeanus]|nr:hypothetical protein BU15DRAFT_63436 [Melanogaster broomeanus]
MSYPQPVHILGDSIVCPSHLLTSSLTEGVIPNPLFDEDEVRLEANGEESKDMIQTEGKETKVLIQAEDNAFVSQSFAAFPITTSHDFVAVRLSESDSDPDATDETSGTLTSEASLENYKWISVVAPNLMTDVWITILHFCDVPEIMRIGMTCLSLYLLTQHSHAVWYHVLLRIAQDKRLYCLMQLHRWFCLSSMPPPATSASLGNWNVHTRGAAFRCSRATRETRYFSCDRITPTRPSDSSSLIMKPPFMEEDTRTALPSGVQRLVVESHMKH